MSSESITTDSLSSCRTLDVLIHVWDVRFEKSWTGVE